jgi:hypothetical protein
MPKVSSLHSDSPLDLTSFEWSDFSGFCSCHLQPISQSQGPVAFPFANRFGLFRHVVQFKAWNLLTSHERVSSTAGCSCSARPVVIAVDRSCRCLTTSASCPRTPIGGCNRPSSLSSVFVLRFVCVSDNSRSSHYCSRVSWAVAAFCTPSRAHSLPHETSSPDASTAQHIAKSVGTAVSVPVLFRGEILRHRPTVYNQRKGANHVSESR